MNAFPWREAMQFGFGVLKLDPKTFWSMTPRELAAAHAALYRHAAPIDRGSLAALMRDFPDQSEPTKEPQDGWS